MRKKSVLSREEFVEELKELIATKYGNNIRRFAAAIGEIDEETQTDYYGYIHQILKGDKNPSPRLLQKLGFESTELLYRKKTAA